jgi:hypothetical protein
MAMMMFLSVFGCGVKTRKSPAVMGRVRSMSVVIQSVFPSARIVGGRLLGDDAAGRAVLVDQALANQTTRERGHWDTFRPGLVVKPRD